MFLLFLVLFGQLLNVLIAELFQRGFEDFLGLLLLACALLAPLFQRDKQQHGHNDHCGAHGHRHDG